MFLMFFVCKVHLNALNQRELFKRSILKLNPREKSKIFGLRDLNRAKTNALNRVK